MMAIKHTPHGLRHGQALALQYAVQILMNVKREPEIVQRVLSAAALNAKNAVKTTVLGCEYATRIMLPLVVEVALKALVAKDNNDEAEGTHRLCELHDALRRNVQGELNREFEHIKRSELPVETRSLRGILADHDNDFLDWRYLDDADRLLGDSIDTLQYVACAVLSVYNWKAGDDHEAEFPPMGGDRSDRLGRPNVP